jgi:hypothetical protein
MIVRTTGRAAAVRTVGLIALLAVFGLAGCKQSKGPPGPPPFEPEPERLELSEEEAAAFLMAQGAKLTRDETQPDKPVIGLSLGYDTTDVDRVGIMVFDSGGGPHDGFAARSRRIYKSRDSKTQNAVVNEVVALKRLTRLAIYNGWGINDAGIKGFAGLENLTNLTLHGAQVADQGLVELAACKNLKTLSVGSVKKPALVFAALPNLEELRFSCYELTREDTRVIAEMAGLKSLDITAAELGQFSDDKKLAKEKVFQSANLQELAKLKNLTSFRLFVENPTGGGWVAELEQLANLEKLSTFELAFSNISRPDLDRFAKLGKLTSLQLDVDLQRQPNLDIGKLSALKKLTSLSVRWEWTEIVPSAAKKLREIGAADGARRSWGPSTN